MVTAITPQEYFYKTPSQQMPEPPPVYRNIYTQADTQTREVIPSWVPILIGLSLIGAFAVALYAISKSD